MGFKILIFYVLGVFSKINIFGGMETFLDIFGGLNLHWNFFGVF